MTYAVLYGILFAHVLLQAILQNLDLTAYVHQEAAYEAIASDVHVGAIERAQKLMTVRDKEQHIGRIIIVRHPFSVR